MNLVRKLFLLSFGEREKQYYDIDANNSFPYLGSKKRPWKNKNFFCVFTMHVVSTLMFGDGILEQKKSQFQAILNFFESIDLFSRIYMKFALR